MSLRKDMVQLCKEAKQQGWVITQTNGKHLKWVAPNGVFFFSASSPSDPRTILNTRQDLIRNGFISVKKKKGRNK